VVFAAIIARTIHYHDYLNHDVAIHLQEAQLLLQGKLPYLDFFNIQLPLIYYLSIPIVWFVQAFNVPFSIATSSFVILLILYSFFASLAVLYKARSQIDWELLIPLLFSWLLFNLPLFIHFGERDHIFVLTFAPYFLMRWLRQQDQSFSKSLSIIIGIIAGIGISLKAPYFLVILAALECYWYLVSKHVLVKRIHSRIRDPEFLACSTVIILCPLVFIATCPNDVRTILFTRWIPLAYNGYAAHREPLDQLLALTAAGVGRILTSLITVAAVCLIGISLYRKNKLIGPLLVWTVAGFIIYLWQGKGWPYQTIPMAAGFFLLANLEFATLSRWLAKIFRQVSSGKPVGSTGPTTRTLATTFVIYCCILSCCLPLLMRDSLNTGARLRELTAALLKYSRKGDPVLILSQWIGPAYPTILQTGRKPASRYLWTSPIEMCELLKLKSASLADKQSYDALEQKIVDEICYDVSKTHPPLIIIFPYLSNVDPSVTLWSCMANHGFSKVLVDYIPLGSWNGNYIWVRVNHASSDTGGTT
jgi:hypothetical protein